MKVAAALAAFTLLVGSAFASPAADRLQDKRQVACGTVGAYQCTSDFLSMEVCDWDGVFKRLNPGCNPNEKCKDNAYGNNIPYCLSDVPPKLGSEEGAPCTQPGSYVCNKATTAILVCDLSHTYRLNGAACPNTCKVISGIPYCF